MVFSVSENMEFHFNLAELNDGNSVDFVHMKIQKFRLHKICIQKEPVAQGTNVLEISLGDEEKRKIFTFLPMLSPCK